MMSLQREGMGPEDRQRSKARFGKQWIDVDGQDTKLIMEWRLETRTENYGVGNVRMGDVVVRGTLLGALTLAIDPEDRRR